MEDRDDNGKEVHVVRRRDITEEEKQGRGMKERERERRKYKIRR